MMEPVVWGLFAGLGALGVSEALLSRWSREGKQAVWTLPLAATVMRSLWMLGSVTVILVSGRVDPVPFVITALLSYAAAQAFEIIRYQRFIHER